MDHAVTHITQKTHTKRSPSVGIGQMATLNSSNCSLESSKPDQTGFFTNYLILDAKMGNTAKKRTEISFALPCFWTLPPDGLPLQFSAKPSCKTNPNPNLSPNKALTVGPATLAAQPNHDGLVKASGKDSNQKQKNVLRFASNSVHSIYEIFAEYIFSSRLPNANCLYAGSVES